MLSASEEDKTLSKLQNTCNYTNKHRILVSYLSLWITRAIPDHFCRLEKKKLAADLLLI